MKWITSSHVRNIRATNIQFSHSREFQFSDFTMRAVRHVLTGHTISSVFYVGYSRRSFSTVSSEKDIIGRLLKNLEFSSSVYLLLLIWKQRVLRLFPFLKGIEAKVSIYISFFCSLILLKVFYLLGSLLMDELHQAVAPFLHASGGINEGGFSQPPIPTPPPENSSLGLIPGAQSEGDHPNSNHDASGSSQEAHQGGVAKKKLYTVLKRHLKKYCTSPGVAEKYPYLKEEDFEYFAQHIALTELDIDENKDDVEIANLSKYINNYKIVKLLLEQFFESYYKKNYLHRLLQLFFR